MSKICALFVVLSNRSSQEGEGSIVSCEVKKGRVTFHLAVTLAKIVLFASSCSQIVLDEHNFHSVSCVVRIVIGRRIAR